MKITGGTLRGRNIISKKEIRPSTSFLKEALFNIIAFELKDKKFLDLFAGTGAIGIEALSRGAKFVCFVDNDRKAYLTILQNLKNNNLENQSKIINWDITKNLKCIRDEKFDIIFIDPPYERKLLEISLENLKKANALKGTTMIILEYFSREKIEIPDDFTIFDRRKYGKSTLLFLKIAS